MCDDVADAPNLLSIAEAGARMRDGRLSARALTAACLDAIDRLDGTYRAFVTVAADALSQADAADAALAAGDPHPLCGIPVSLKDLTPTKGLRTTFGSSLFADHIPEEDDIVAARLRATGAVMIGKTNTPEFGYGTVVENALCGPTANPFDPERTSGGSSGGAAVSVSLGMCVAAIGSDFGGSVRLPAALCGIVGLRPAIGRIPTVPKTHAWQNFVACGTFGRSVADAATLAAALAGPDVRDPVSLRSGPGGSAAFASPVRIAYAAGLGFAPIDRGVERVLDRAMEAVATRHRVEPIEALVTPTFQHSYEVLRGAFLHDEYAALVEEHGERLSPTLRWNVRNGGGLSAVALMTAERDRSVVYRNVLAVLERNDVVASAAAPVPAFANADGGVHAINGRPLRNMIDYSAVSLVASMTGFPCLSIPCGTNEDGLPVGLQLMARPDREAALLAFAQHLERDLGLRSILPLPLPVTP